MKPDQWPEAKALRKATREVGRAIAAHDLLHRKTERALRAKFRALNKFYKARTRLQSVEDRVAVLMAEEK